MYGLLIMIRVYRGVRLRNGPWVPQCSYTYLYATKTASGARITWTVFMQNKTITFRLKKHFEPVKGLLLRFLFFPPVISHIPTTLRHRRRSLSISHVSTTNTHTNTIVACAPPPLSTVVLPLSPPVGTLHELNDCCFSSFYTHTTSSIDAYIYIPRIRQQKQQ